MAQDEDYIAMNAKQFAKLLKKCAFECEADNKTRIEAAAMGPTAHRPSSRGREICRQTARGMDLVAFGDIAYFLLAYTWNDALQWADTHGAE